MQLVSIANIDCDLYISTVDALQIIYPKLQQGSVLLVDDYNAFCANRHQGQRKAIREFLHAYPKIEFEPWFTYSHLGQAFIVHLNPNED